MFLLFDKVWATHGSDYSWKIGVAHSYRDEAGKSHHVKIAHIGSFKVRNWKYTERRYCEAQKLWEKADRVFNELDLSPDDEAKLRRALEKRIPQPPPIPQPIRAKGKFANWCKPDTWPNLYAFKPHGYKPKP